MLILQEMLLRFSGRTNDLPSPVQKVAYLVISLVSLTPRFSIPPQITLSWLCDFHR